MDLKSLQALYVDELRDLLSAEKQLVKALPKMAKAASNSQLQQAFQLHLEQTRGHVERLEQVFQTMNMTARAKKCKGMEGLITEAQELMEEEGDPAVLDAGLIAGAQKVEHYEIAGYGTVRTYARLLGYNDAVNLLQQTLDEEGETDKKLTQIAESSVNLEAAAPAGEAAIAGVGGNGRNM
jgi:ferritin-like metal-binding protein YciE